MILENPKKIKRRKFIKMSLLGTATASAGALILNSGRIINLSSAFENELILVPQDPKKVFSKCMTCSNTFFTLLNREFGCPDEVAEFASDPLAGGMMNTQNQCGMLWGATLAVGAESFRRCNDHSFAISKAIIGTKNVVQSFVDRAKSVNCRNIVGFDGSKNIGVIEFIVKSLPNGYQNMICMNLAESWAPEAILSAKKGLLSDEIASTQKALSCSSEVVKRMGGNEEEMVMVAGFAGGIGFSGHACGALSAAIWMDTLAWCRNNPGKSGYLNPNSEIIMERFRNIADSEILCSELSGEKFNTIDDHTNYIKNGGCEKLIQALSTS
jgi:Putative redox-active protein (C_GCAxxG_C_C)